MYALYLAVNYIVDTKLPGEFVECGVWAGGSAMMIAEVLIKRGIKDKKIYLYDTYEGMVEPTKEDKTISKGVSPWKFWKISQKNKTNSWCFCPIEEVKRNMSLTKYPSEKIVYVKGKVEQTLPKLAPKNIALLRLDTDWYESSYHEMKHLFPLLKAIPLHA